ncbi:hypothetical protein CUMW_262220 [Citrus unshiu]|uniref:Protein kinase domain-containing protein n=1 Tax=Citrus unshiu TaxID=55188 RepID=A0A2H5QU91_CITUN|nr:hypothetical protein CUMW_262220 [Citrus unshiu]
MRIISKGHYSERAAALVFTDIMNNVNVCRPKASKDENACLKVIDFGLASFFEEGKDFLVLHYAINHFPDI